MPDQLTGKSLGRCLARISHLIAPGRIGKRRPIEAKGGKIGGIARIEDALDLGPIRNQYRRLQVADLVASRNAVSGKVDA